MGSSSTIESINTIEIPVYETHFDEGKFLPNLLNDDLLEVLAGIKSSHTGNKKCLLELHPNISADKQDIHRRRLHFVESIIHDDENGWLNIVKDASTSDIQTFMKYLSSKGWPCDPGQIDGVNGPKTWTGVYLFQHACNQVFEMDLEMDGICGPKTWGGVFKAIKTLLETEANT